MEFEKQQESVQKYTAECTHVVIKLGTNILTPHIENIDADYFYRLGLQIQKLISAQKRVLVVSSGAVGFGKKIRNIKSPVHLSEKQALASLGQGLLIDTYRENFEKAGLETGQILVTPSDFLSRNHYKNLKRTLDQLLEWGAVPVINENDAITVEGLKFGDNDTLSAFIAGMFPQSLLIILTTVDGFYLQNEKSHIITKLEEKHFDSAGDATAGGIGGMKTKLHAAKKIMLSGQVMNIASGEKPEIVEKIMAAEKTGTWFFPAGSATLSFRRRWLLHHKHVLGKLSVDSGAVEAIKKSSASLLLVGVLNVEGNFEKGSVVEIEGPDNEKIAKGISAYSHEEIQDALQKSEKPRGLYVVHRDNMILLEKE